jgi:hypothetical protein
MQARARPRLWWSSYCRRWREAAACWPLPPPTLRCAYCPRRLPGPGPGPRPQAPVPALQGQTAGGFQPPNAMRPHAQVDNLVERLVRAAPKLAVVRMGHPARLLPAVRAAAHPAPTAALALAPSPCSLLLLLLLHKASLDGRPGAVHLPGLKEYLWGVRVLLSMLYTGARRITVSLKPSTTGDTNTRCVPRCWMPRWRRTCCDQTAAPWRATAARRSRR